MEHNALCVCVCVCVLDREWRFPICQLVLVVLTDLGEKRSIPCEKPPVTVTIRYSRDAVELPAATGSALLPGGSRVPASFGGGGEESEHHAACE